MRLIAQALIVASLLAAALSASVAYHVPLDAPDAQLLGLSLQDDADLLWVEDNEPSEPAREVTGERLEELRSAARSGTHASQVRVREFAWSRWQGRWIFVVSIVTMAVGSLILRQQTQAERRQVVSQQQTDTPQMRLAQLAESVRKLRQDLETCETSSDQNRMIVQRVSTLQGTEVVAFTRCHDDLMAELGIGAAAEVLDSFAIAERQLNRAWSAASDHDHQEAMDCLEHTEQLLAQAMAVTAEKEAG